MNYLTCQLNFNNEIKIFKNFHCCFLLIFKNSMYKIHSVRNYEEIFKIQTQV